MTQTLIEKLEALQQYVVNNRDDDMGIGMWPVECKGDYAKMSDIRAIIEQHKKLEQNNETDRDRIKEV